MNTHNYRENGEQGFPFILPVLRSYKQSAMFSSQQENENLKLPNIHKTINIENNKRKKTEKLSFNNSIRKNSLNLKNSPRFIPAGRRSVAY